ncbi:MAG: hypothetical protein ABIG87_02200, partial [Patescibacteria group bacterium]
AAKCVRTILRIEHNVAKRNYAEGESQLFGFRQEAKGGALCEFVGAKRRQGEHREPGSLNFSVRKNIPDQSPPPSTKLKKHFYENKKSKRNGHPIYIATCQKNGCLSSHT